MSSIFSSVARSAQLIWRAIVAFLMGLAIFVSAPRIGAEEDETEEARSETSSHNLSKIAPNAQPGENEQCLLCHGVKNMRSGPFAVLVPYIDAKVHESSAHSETNCVECHVGVDNDYHPDGVPKPQCGYCHEREDEEHLTSVHGQGRTQGVEDVPECQDCHSTHDIYPANDARSMVYPLNLPDTCGRCHADESLVKRHTIEVKDPYRRYLTSAHGQGLIKSGLLVSATCNDCHGTHDIRPHEDPRSKISRKNVPETCGSCHAGLLSEFRRSIHGQKLAANDEDAPTCVVCHASHDVRHIETEEWRLGLIQECSTCHEEQLETYRETYHGQVTSLGYSTVARCSDCHGSHDILPEEDKASRLSEAHRVTTCQQCHPGANRNFAQYIAHPNHHDRRKNPLLFWVYIAMTGLLVSVFSFFGVHTLLWFIRLYRERETFPKLAKTSDQVFLRFGAYERFLHLLVILSFMTLTATGIPLKFNHTSWAPIIVQIFGGFETAGFLHRVSAIITFLYFALHLAKITRKALRGERGLFWGQDSMMPNFSDLSDMIAHFKWFVGLGPRPQFDRWTYWEKFDYWAVFWGVSIIGLSGLMLWFPTAFSLVLPGWMSNIAMIVHSDEALLASGFIFSIHFFNSHLRPDKYPVDTVIFTGRISLEELEHERPLEYVRLKESGKLEKKLVEPVRDWEAKAARTLGITALLLGLLMLVLIITSALLG